MPASTPPFYFIYGQPDRDIDPRFIHVERTSDRHTLHHGHVEPHGHAHLHQLSFWLKSKGIYGFEGHTAPLDGPTIVWMPSGIIHGFEVSADSDAIVVSLSDDFMREFLDSIDLPPVRALRRQPIVQSLPPHIAPRIGAIFEEIEQEYRFPSWAQSHVLGAQIQLAFITLARFRETLAEETSASDTIPSLFSRFLEEVDAHFREQWTVEAYAEAMGTTPYLLNRATQAGSGLRPSQILRARLIQEAKRLLLYTMLDVASVGYALGFEDPAHFGRTFRAVVGQSPARWRDEQKGELGLVLMDDVRAVHS